MSIENQILKDFGAISTAFLAKEVVEKKKKIQDAERAERNMVA